MTPISKSPKINVLAVDDDPLMLELLAAYLEDLSYEAMAENSAEHGMACLFSDRNVDVLVTDVRLPGMDGVEFARMVREAKPSLPIVFVSGYATEAVRCSMPGSVFINKPYSRERLARGIKQVLEWSAS